MSYDVFIADDAGFIREILGNACADLGHHLVGEADSGEEILSMIKMSQPHVVFLDMVMPKKNGTEIAAEIALQFPKIKIVAMSSLDQKLVQQKAFEKGCSYFLRKPFSRDDLQKCFQYLQQNERKVQVG